MADHSAPPPRSSSLPPHPPLFKAPDLVALKLDKNLLASSCVSTLAPTGLAVKYFLRVDKKGLFHTYPDRGGPCESLREAQEAIDSHHAAHRKNVCMDGLSDEERAVRRALYWYHNGTRKHSQQAFDACTTNLPPKVLIKAVLDKYNEDSGLVGDFAYELEKVVNHNACFDGKGCLYRSYYHYNLTMRTKGAEGNNNLYFAEVTCMDGDGKYEAFVLTSICMVKPDDNGECHVCGADIKHPTHAGYNHGRPRIARRGRYNHAYGVALFKELFAVRDEKWLREEEARVRRTIKEGLKAEEASCKFEVDNKTGDQKWLREELARVRRTGLKAEEASCKFVVDNKRGDQQWLKEKEARVRRTRLKAEEASHKFEVDNKRGDQKWLREEEGRVRRTGLKAEEASRKFEVDNKRGDHGNEHKYVIPANRAEHV